MSNKEDLYKQLQQQLDEAKEKTKIQLTDLDEAIKKCRNGLNKKKETLIEKVLREQREKK